MLSFWRKFSDDSQKPVDQPDLSMLDQIAAFFSPGSFYYYLLNFPKFEMELVSSQYKNLTGLPRHTFSVPQWIESVHPEDVAHIQKCEKVAEKFLFEHLRPNEMVNYKVSYTYRRKTANGDYQNNLHQAIALNLTDQGSIGYVLGIEANVDHISNHPTDKVSFVHLNGEKSFLNINTNHPSFKLEGPQYNELTTQEINIIRLISFGLSSKKVASELSISEHTVRTHRANILKKTDSRNMTALVSEFIRKGII